MDTRVIFVNASELAAVLDRNPYENAWETAAKVWRRHSRVTFDASGLKLPGKWVDEMAERHAGLHALLERAGKTPPGDLGETLATAGFFAAKKGWTPTEAKKLEDRVRKESFCGHGNAGESKAISEFEAETGNTVTLDMEYRHREVCVLGDGTSVRLGGRVDGIIEDDRGRGKTIVEIKNRVAGLSYRLRGYEELQLRAYLWVFEARRGVLVERLQFADGKATSCTYEIDSDDDIWDREVSKPLAAMAIFVRRLSTDRRFAEAFVTSRTKNAIFKREMNLHM